MYIQEWWTHVWAIPCNGRDECHDSSDENGCHISNWILASLIIGFIFVLSTTLFFYLYSNLNHAGQMITSMTSNTSKHQDCKLERNLQLAVLVQQKDAYQIKKIFFEELQIHGDESKAICCLKVHYLVNFKPL